MRDGDWRPAVLGPAARVHEDILTGRDAEISWEDVYNETNGGLNPVAEGMGVHEEMERRVGMGKW